VEKPAPVPIWIAATKVPALRALGCAKTINAWCADGSVPARRFGKKWFIHSSSLKSLESLEALPEGK